MLCWIVGVPLLFLAIKQENCESIFNWSEIIPDIPENFQWMGFLRDHNELNLEMLTNEKKEYMYLVYPNEFFIKGNGGINKRLAPLLDNDQRKIELLFATLFATPITSPLIYYGDEIGMGDNIYLAHRNGLQTPMQWNDSRNAGFSDSVPSKLYQPIIIDPEYHYSTINVEVQKDKPSSLYNFLKKLIACRKKYKSLRRGQFFSLPVFKKEIIFYLISYQDETILFVGNLSNKSQYIELDLSDYQGVTLIEVYNDVIFPQITENPYIITLNPYGFYYLKFF
jgi:maltose alpha-D-glucosyltransferase/alpha-amylase